MDTDCYFEESDYYEVTETQYENPPSPPPPPSVKSKSLVWPPAKPIEEITYPTASPIYINPNPALNHRHQRSVREIYQSQEIEQEREIEVHREFSQEPIRMEYATCSGPVYRRVQVCGVTDQRESRSREAASSRPISRPVSRESLRRSLTPTRIYQPTPQPWTATVTTGTNLYEPCPTAQPLICHEICEQEQICQSQLCHGSQLCHESHQTCERRQIAHHHHQICQQPCQLLPKPAVYRPVCPPKPPQPVCLFKAPEPEPEPEPQPSSPVVQTEVSFTFRRPNSANSVKSLAEIVPPDVAVCPDGVESQRDYRSETTEKDDGPLHIKKITIYEKTVEVVDPDDQEPSEAKETEGGSSYGNEIEANTTSDVRRSANLDQEVENISERRDVVECAEIVSSAVDTQQLVEKIKQEDQESKVEDRSAATQEISSSVLGAQGKRLSITEHEDMEGGGYLDRHTTVEEDDACRYEELTEEIRMQDSYREPDIEEERIQSLREQVQVHQCLREQQIPERRPPPQTLQERRLSSKYGQQDYSCSRQQTVESSCNKKHVQFVTETECGMQPMPPTPVKNSTPKQWQSDMVKALTVAPRRCYSPLSNTVLASMQRENFAEEYCPPQTCQEVPQQPRKEVRVQRAVSPFRDALTTASNRPYTPLGFYDSCQSVECQSVQETCCRSQTPTVGADGYCAPAEILYMDAPDAFTHLPRKRERKVSERSMTPQPLPTPPPDYKLRDSSLPPRSRSGTPSSRSFMGLKKPGTIPPYQRNLASMNRPADGQNYQPSRTPTPTAGRSKSPGQGQAETASFTKAQAPMIRDDPPPTSKSPSSDRPNKKLEEEGESYTYHEEKNTPRGRLLTDVEGSMRVSYAGDEQAYVASEKEVIETLKEFKKKPVPVVKQNCVPIAVECQLPKCEPCPILTCNISKPAECPIGKSQSDKFPRTGVCVLPPCPKTIVHSNQKNNAFCGTQSTTSQRTVTQSQKSAFCGTVPKPCPPSSIERKTVTISPCPGIASKNCGQSSSNSCGRLSGSLGGASPLTGVSITPCGDGSVLVAPCPKPILKGQCPFARSPSADLPYPQIPMPYDNVNEPVCPFAEIPVPELNDLGFQPIHTPRTNLGSQLTQLVHKTNKQLVQVYKPQAQCSSVTQCQTQSQCNLLDPISKTQNLVDPPNLSSHPDLGTGGLGAGSKSGAVAGNTAPKRGRGILTQQGGPGSRVPLCGHCNTYVRYRTETNTLQGTCICLLINSDFILFMFYRPFRCVSWLGMFRLSFVRPFIFSLMID